MGDIAEMMLSGVLCEGCGCYIDDNDEGIPRYCSPQCAADRGAEPISRGGHGNRVNCPVCGKRVKAIGLADHTRDVHQKAGQ